MIKNLEKINIVLIIFGIVILSFFVSYTGIKNLLTKDYTSLGDPYYTNQILAFKRAPLLIWITIEILLLMVIQFIILIIKKIWRKS